VEFSNFTEIDSASPTPVSHILKTCTHMKDVSCLPDICAVGECCVENIQHTIHMSDLHHNPCVIEQH